MTVSYLPLIRTQHSHHPKAPVDRTFSSAQEMLAHSASVRERLRRESPKQPIVALPEAISETDSNGVPLNMLRACSWRFLVEYAALAGGVDASDILGSNRTREVVDARHHALVLTYQHTQASLPAIGRLFGKDHSTVCYAMNKYNARGKLVDLFEGTRALLRPNSGRKLPLRVDDPHTPRTALQKAVARAYKNGVPTRVLVEELGTTSNAVNVMAHRLGLRRKPLDGGAG